MAHNKAYHEVEKEIEKARRTLSTELYLNKKFSGSKLTELPKSLGQLKHLHLLDLSGNYLTTLPDWLGQLRELRSLNLSYNALTTLPESLGQLRQLRSLNIDGNQLTTLPDSFSNLKNLKQLIFGSVGGGNSLKQVPECIRYMDQLEEFWFVGCDLKIWPFWFGELRNLKKLLGNLEEFPNCFQRLTKLEVLNAGGSPTKSLRLIPDWFGELENLQILYLYNNNIIDLPSSLTRLENLKELNLINNPLNPELAEAYKQGVDAVKAYLRAKAAAQITLNEAKLILVGEGEVGKSCLMDALQGVAWQEHDTTHGIEIRQINATDTESKKEITLNGWDFGGQRVYRPTHQLFFSAPAVYLVVWKPREGPQQGFVKEWIRLVKHREPDAKILVVATHGGPQQRQPDIDRQELYDLFGKDTVLGFYFVDSKPDVNGNRRGIDQLKQAIARVAAALPEVGRSVPKRWQEAREALEKNGAAYLSFADVLEICRNHQMDENEARLFVTIEHRLGHLIHYENDPALHDIVILKPNWLSNAMSFVLDDEETRKNHGLVRFLRLSRLWNDPKRADESRYPIDLHPIFLRLMERFDLSYRVAGLPLRSPSDDTSLIAQLVPDNRPDPVRGWVDYPLDGNIEQMQICRIVDDKGQSATAEGLFYQLIVRLHKYSLGRANYNASIHWQRGLVLDDDYNGRALLEYKGNDVHITVRAPYPERFLAMLTAEVKYLVENFWQGLRCDVMVPCVKPCGKNEPGAGLYQVEKLIDSKRKNRPEFPCPVCNEWQNIDLLLRNAPAARPISLDELLAQFALIKDKLDIVDVNTRRILSQIDQNYTDLLHVLTDEAKEGPRLFSLVPVNRAAFNPKQWTSAQFRLTLWCEHSRLPLPELYGKDSKRGVYGIELTRDWFKKAAPFLKVVTGTLSLVLPVASSGIKLAMDDAAYKAIENQLDFGKEVIEESLKGSEQAGGWLGKGDATALEHGESIRAEGATLRELHALLKAKDPGFGGLVRVMNKRQEFLWVHPKFASEY